MLTQARFHRPSNPQGLVNPCKVVVHVKQRNHRHVVLNLLAESIRKSREASHVHSHVEILTLDIARGDMRLIRVTDDFDTLCPKTLRRAITERRQEGGNFKWTHYPRFWPRRDSI